MSRETASVLGHLLSTCVAIGSWQGILEEPALSEVVLLGRKTSEEADVEAERVVRGQKAGFHPGKLGTHPSWGGSAIHPFGKASVCFFDQEKKLLSASTLMTAGDTW